MKCLGCGSDIGALGDTVVLSYTCPCGATIFYEPPLHFQTGSLFVKEGVKILIPISLPRSIVEKRDLPHLDYYLGKSAHTNEDKERFIEILRGLGAVWSWECQECSGHVAQKTRMELGRGVYRFPLHPELAKLVEK